MPETNFVAIQIGDQVEFQGDLSEPEAIPNPENVE